jgi:diacylglycerol kinase (ATP)
MKFKNIHFIVNPASGKEEPILTYLQRAFYEKQITWNVTVTHSDADAFNTAKSLIGKTDLAVVYGGDGSITQVARALYGSETPMGIIPGGTANVMSKELGIPQDSEKAIELFVNGSSKIIKMDMGEANGCPFLLRINLGIMADMILNADAALKNKLGQIAYGITAIKTIDTAKPTVYKLMIDGKEIKEEGVSLTVTNAGNIGIADLSLLPGISIDDGFLDVILLKDANLLSVLQVAGTTLFQTASDVLKRWKCKEVTITMNKSTKYICDDCEEKAKVINIKILPLALNVVVPSNKS